MFMLGDKPYFGDHSVANSYADLRGVVGVERYDLRAAAFHAGRPQDGVRLPRSLEQAWGVTREYFERSLSLASPQAFYSDDPTACPRAWWRDKEPVFFKLQPWMVKYHPELEEQARLVAKFENKRNFLKLCQSVGAPMPPTRDVRAFWQKFLPPVGFCQAWHKPLVGASGNGMARTTGFGPTWREILRRPCPFQLQRHVDGVVCSTQLLLGERGVMVLSTTDQVMVGRFDNEHAGNAFPSLYGKELTELARCLGNLVYGLGYRGFCGFDFMVEADQSRGVIVYVLEMNARLTGAHYPLALAQKLHLEQFLHRSVEGLRPDLREPQALLASLGEASQLWTRDRPEGVIPWFLGTVDLGKVMLIIPGDRQAQAAGLDRFQQLCCQ